MNNVVEQVIGWSIGLGLYAIGMLVTAAAMSYAKGCRKRRAIKEGRLEDWKFWIESDWDMCIQLGAVFWPFVLPSTVFVFIVKFVYVLIIKIDDIILTPLGSWFEKLGEEKGCGK